MEHWHKSYKSTLDKLIIQQRTLLERIRIENEELAKLKDTKNTIDDDIVNLEDSLNKCNEAKIQLEETITNAKKGYDEMINSGNTLLELTNRSIEEMKNLHTLTASRLQSSNNSINMQEKLATIARKEVTTEIDIAAKTQEQIQKREQIQSHEHKDTYVSVKRRPFQWYSAEYYNKIL